MIHETFFGGDPVGFNPCSLFPEGSPGWLVCMGIGGAIGIIPGDDPIIPGDPAPGDPAPPVPGGVDCPTGQVWVENKRGGAGCVDITPDFQTPAELVASGSMHPMGHADTVPAIRDVRTRRCRRGSVLGKDGWCHPRGTITNRDRLYPKPPRPLGTRAELKAVRVAGSFGRRLVANKKRLKKLEMALHKVT